MEFGKLLMPLAPAAASGGPVRLQTLMLLRWFAVLGQALSILLVHFGFEFDLPLVPSLSLVGLSIAVNVFLFVAYPASARLSDRGATISLGFDLVQLSALLYFTGGIGNPFALLLLVPVTVAGTILTLRRTLMLGALAFFCATFLVFHYEPLPWGDEKFDLPELYRLGHWVALVMGTALLGAYARRLADEARRMSDALAETQAVLSREQQLSALGGLAAAAAHELGTPLGTIAVVARELTRELPPGTPLAEDASLLLSQAQRCRDILKRFAQRPEAEAEAGGDAFAFPFFPALVEAALDPHRGSDVEIELAVPPGDQPVVARRPEIIQGIGNLVENAVDFAKSRVIVTVGWSAERMFVRIADDGPGFSADILSAIGEPYITTRPETGGMGLGVFIAKTLLERTGARLSFANRPAGGAAIEIVWRRAILQRSVEPADGMI
jgi:two-component system sensor histidine kinase RegB